MYCPSCGSEERQASQYCRACGTDLRPVRISLERPDSVTASAVSARADIGRAVADRIRDVEDAHELKKVAEDVLPQIEKFLESYEEKRLRRMRAGVVVSSIGVGFSVLMFLMTASAQPNDVQGFLGGAGLGIVTLCIGLGLLLNAFVFTRPGKRLQDNSADARSQNLLDTGAPTQLRAGREAQAPTRVNTTSNLVQPGSVTEHTTLHLKSELQNRER
ncbi:MAG TPA: hypothetical protein DC054_02470 [Blastocatellia bacterium]|nr:hypothetical protein [Blastocatellia bacterium]